MNEDERERRRRESLASRRSGTYGGEFRPTMPKAVYCSPTCRTKADQARRRAWARPAAPKEET